MFPTIIPTHISKFASLSEWSKLNLTPRNGVYFSIDHTLNRVCGCLIGATSVETPFKQKENEDTVKYPTSPNQSAKINILKAAGVEITPRIRSTDAIEKDANMTSFVFGVIDGFDNYHTSTPLSIDNPIIRERPEYYYARANGYHLGKYVGQRLFAEMQLNATAEGSVN